MHQLHEREARQRLCGRCVQERASGVPERGRSLGTHRVRGCPALQLHSRCNQHTNIFCCVLASWILLLPSDRLAFMQSLLATLTFTNNALAATQNGYFDNITELKPLIHTWSFSLWK